MNNIVNVKYSLVLKKRWSFITVITLVVVLLSLIFSLVQPFKYESEVNILVIQKSSLGIDAYSASKSAERIGRNLGQIVYSSSFLSKVLNSGYEIDKSYFPAEEDQKRDFWEKTIATEVPANTTILHVSVFHEDKEQATIIAQAVAYVLDQEVEEYVGISDVDLKVVDAPLTSTFPVKPNIILNVILGLVVGFFLAVAIVMVTYSEARHLQEVYKAEEKKQRKSQLKSVKKQKKNKFAKVNFQATKPDQSADSAIKMPDVEQALHVEPKETLEQKAHLIAQEQQAPEENGSEPEKPAYENLPKFQTEDEIKTMYEE